MQEAIAGALDNNCQRVYIAYSGGLDSHVLLHCCASITQFKGKFTAVYIDHGLQAEAKSWVGHCEKIAKGLGIDFLTLQVNARAIQGESPEEAARNARYAALKSLINVDDALLLAQHREDQLETVLLQLFRGSGLSGLSGMPKHIAFGLGVMLRPLLNTPKQIIIDYAHAHQLSWVEDPSNQCNDYDRNFLRNAVLPLLKKRWPAIDKTVARSAKHCADAQVLVEGVAEGLFNVIFNPEDNTLCISRLLEQSGNRSFVVDMDEDNASEWQQGLFDKSGSRYLYGIKGSAVDIRPQLLVIRRWLGYMGLKMPTQDFVRRILTEVVAAGELRDPVLSGQGYSIRRYRDKLYCLKQARQKLPQDCVWPTGQASIKISLHQALSCTSSSAGILREQWQAAKVDIRFRCGGEKICLPGRQGHHSLKNLFQEAGIPPWERGVMPLVYLNDTLAAVGDKWISAAFFCEKSQGCVSLLLQSYALKPKDHDEFGIVD